METVTAKVPIEVGRFIANNVKSVFERYAQVAGIKFEWVIKEKTLMQIAAEARFTGEERRVKLVMEYVYDYMNRMS